MAESEILYNNYFRTPEKARDYYKSIVECKDEKNLLPIVQDLHIIVDHKETNIIEDNYSGDLNVYAVNLNDKIKEIVKQKYENHNIIVKIAICIYHFFLRMFGISIESELETLVKKLVKKKEKVELATQYLAYKNNLFELNEYSKNLSLNSTPKTPGFDHGISRLELQIQTMEKQLGNLGVKLDELKDIKFTSPLKTPLNQVKFGDQQFLVDSKIFNDSGYQSPNKYNSKTPKKTPKKTPNPKSDGSFEGISPIIKKFHSPSPYKASPFKVRTPFKVQKDQKDQSEDLSVVLDRITAYFLELCENEQDMTLDTSINLEDKEQKLIKMMSNFFMELLTDSLSTSEFEIESEMVLDLFNKTVSHVEPNIKNIIDEFGTIYSKLYETQNEENLDVSVQDGLEKIETIEKKDEEEDEVEHNDKLQEFINSSYQLDATQNFTFELNYEPSHKEKDLTRLCQLYVRYYLSPFIYEKKSEDDKELEKQIREMLKALEFSDLKETYETWVKMIQLESERIKKKITYYTKIINESKESFTNAYGSLNRNGKLWNDMRHKHNENMKFKEHKLEEYKKFNANIQITLKVLEDPEYKKSYISRFMRIKAKEKVVVEQ